MSSASSSPNEWPLETCAQRLEGSDSYRVLRRLPSLQLRPRALAPGERIVAIVDTETTGLDHLQDEVIEFAGITFAYRTDGKLTDPISSFSALREPSIPLGADIVRITGIDEDMLKGKTIDKAALNNFIEPADLIVAHNASFDRPFCEQISSVFEDKPWACSAIEVDWAGLGFDGTKLTYLAAHSGWFYDAHRALDDCNALAKVLATPVSGSELVTPFQQLLISARETKTRLSFSAPYPLRAALRRRGFRWMASDQLQPGFWFSDLSEREVEPTVQWLTKDLGLRKAVINLSRMTAVERYR